MLIFVRQALINPVPDESPLQAGELTERLPVAIEPAKTVTHRMGIFTEDQRTGLFRQTNPFFNRPFRHGIERLILIDAGIHRADDIGGSGIGTAPFVLHRTAGIVAFDPAVERIMGTAVAGLVAERPENDARVVPVTLNHAGHAFAEGIKPGRIV